MVSDILILAPASALVLIITTAILTLLRRFKRPPLPPGPLFSYKGWPIVGSSRFFTARGEFFREGKQKSPNGHFNFYYGAYPVAVLSGKDARQSFYTARGMSLRAGFGALFVASPNVDEIEENRLTAFFNPLFKRFVGKENLARVLPHLFRDVHNEYQSINASALMDPFEVLYRTVYKMSHRTTGCYDVADDPKLAEETLGLMNKIDGSSPIEILFPSLTLIPSKMRKRRSYSRLHNIINSIIADRRKTGKREEDAMQWMMDNGDTDPAISGFIIASLFAGIINTGAQAAWVLCYLAKYPYWHTEFCAEVDRAISKHRATNNETPADILGRLTLEELEAEFPIIYAGFRDSIRLNLPGASMRKNITGKDIKIGETGVIIPRNAFAFYVLEDVHMDESIYKDPLEWDPSRHLEKKEGQDEPLGFLGWGAGINPCLGVKMATLAVTITTAMFLATFNFEMCDKKGNPTTKILPGYDINILQVQRPLGKVFFKLERKF